MGQFAERVEFESTGPEGLSLPTRRGTSYLCISPIAEAAGFEPANPEGFLLSGQEGYQLPLYASRIPVFHCVPG